MNLSEESCPIYSQSTWENTSMECDGLFVYRNFKAGSSSIQHFLQEFLNQEADFNQCFGAYRAVIHISGTETIFFSDNSGQQVFFINNKTSSVYQGLLESCPAEQRIPDFSSVTQLMMYGNIWGNRTIFEDVIRSDPECYYRLDGNKLITYSKNLTPISDLPFDPDILGSHIQRMLAAMDNQYSIACSITGGVDSRAILSHLLFLKCKPRLSITGRENHIDVVIAKRIAETLQLPIDIYTPAPDEENWLRNTIHAVDGMTGPYDIYRLYREAKGLQEAGCQVKFGGAAGELYKNSFINQDFPFYFGKPRLDKFIKMKIPRVGFRDSDLGDRIQALTVSEEKQLAEQLRKHLCPSKSRSYLNAGYKIMQSRIITVSTMASRYYVSYSPLMERDVAAWAYHQKPFTLELQSFQREQVTKYCPQIKDIPTDRGLSCSSCRKIPDMIKNYLFLMQIAFERLFARASSPVPDECQKALTETAEFQHAFEVCRKYHFISSDCSISKLSLRCADLILELGSLFP